MAEAMNVLFYNYVCVYLSILFYLWDNFISRKSSQISDFESNSFFVTITILNSFNMVRQK